MYICMLWSTADFCVNLFELKDKFKAPWQWIICILLCITPYFFTVWSIRTKRSKIWSYMELNMERISPSFELVCCRTINLLLFRLLYTIIETSHSLALLAPINFLQMPLICLSWPFNSDGIIKIMQDKMARLMYIMRLFYWVIRWCKIRRFSMSTSIYNIPFYMVEVNICNCKYSVITNCFTLWLLVITAVSWL